MPISEVYNMDCLEGMKGFPDKFFDLAIVDPPYGINHANKAGKMSGQQYGNAAAPKRSYTSKDWDLNIPKEDYFSELRRVSKNRIIWGGNYMVEYLDASAGWIVWDKVNGENGFSDCELAYTSFNKGLRKLELMWNGMLQHDMSNKEERIHPTQKPVKLYKWLLKNYAKEGDKILDTHMGSQSSRIAAYNMGFDYWGFELDREYFEAGNKRFKEQTAQQQLFV